MPISTFQPLVVTATIDDPDTTAEIDWTDTQLDLQPAWDPATGFV